MRLSAAADQQLPDPEVIRTIIPGITEGGAIILGVLTVLILVLFYFGRILAKREIELPRPRDLEVTYTPEFTGIVHELRAHIGAMRKPVAGLAPASEIAQ